MDWNTITIFTFYNVIWSPSARKVWIEILLSAQNRDNLCVTFREEGVDWNGQLCYLLRSEYRHLPRGRCGLKSLMSRIERSFVPVTFREEGVDWNNHHLYFIIKGYWRHLPRGRCGLKSPSIQRRHKKPMTSPSARKVWIEILLSAQNRDNLCVTFREEGVDWNVAWFFNFVKINTVTFREEGVDWNNQ